MKEAAAAERLSIPITLDSDGSVQNGKLGEGSGAESRPVNTEIPFWELNRLLEEYQEQVLVPAQSWPSFHLYSRKNPPEGPGPFPLDLMRRSVEASIASVSEGVDSDEGRLIFLFRNTKKTRQGGWLEDKLAR